MIHDVAGKGVNKLHRASTSGVTLSRNLIIIIHSRLWKSSTRGEAEELTEDHDEKERPPTPPPPPPPPPPPGPPPPPRRSVGNRDIRG